MTQPQVSVCILTCNQKQYIRQCIESVLLQMPDVTLEILVGDDCSDDGTSEIVAKMVVAYPSYIRHLRHVSRLGASANYQTLLRCVSGKYVAHLDGDDYWLPGKMRRQVEYLIRNVRCMAVYTNALTICEDGTSIGIFNNVGSAEYDLAKMLIRGNFLNTSSMLFRSELRHLLLEIEGPFIDYRIHLRLARQGFLAQLAEPLTVYRVSSVGSMIARSNALVRGLYWESLMDVPRELVRPGDFARGIADFLRRVIFRAVRTRRWNLVREWTPLVFKASPYGAARTSLLVLGSVIRAAIIQVSGWVLLRIGKTKVKVLYRR